MSIYRHHNYAGYLKEVLLDKARKNPSFSLRAMARQLSLPPSLLSEVFSGKRHLTEDNAVMVAERLGLNEAAREYFRTLVQLGRAKKPQVKEVLLRKLRTLHPDSELKHDLSVDQFVMISDACHFALMRLMDVEDFDFSVKSAAAVLGIHPLEVEAALERLARLELIERDAGGSCRKTKDNVMVRSPNSNDALKKYHSQMLEKTIDALGTQKNGVRFTGTEDLTLSADQMRDAEEIFERCFKEILALSRRRGKGAEVYHLGIHMFRLSDRTKWRKK